MYLIGMSFLIIRQFVARDLSALLAVDLLRSGTDLTKAVEVVMLAHISAALQPRV